jgi:hypothetical protein
MTGKDATGAFAISKARWFRGKNFRLDSAEAAGADDSGLLAGGSDTTVSASLASLWWLDSLSGSSMEVTAAKAATAMAERGRWRGAEKKAITADSQ